MKFAQGLKFTRLRSALTSDKLLSLVLIGLIVTVSVLYVLATLVGNAISEDEWSWWLFGIGFEEQGAWYEVARASVAFAAGLGIGAAVLLSYRRQSLLERRENFDVDNEEYRRASELYNSAVEQLGHESPTIRLAAMYSFGRLGDAHREFRQNVMDIWCAYLRMPLEIQTGSSQQQNESSFLQRGQLERAEMNVRDAAQHLIVERLRATGPQSWHDGESVSVFSVDLHGATLNDFRASYVRFTGDTSFAGAQFNGNTSFYQATFWGLPVNFSNVTFEGIASFSKSNFSSEVSFEGADFKGQASFSRAKFVGGCDFSNTSFNGFGDFSKLECAGDATFYKAKFQYPSFSGSRWAGEVVFTETQFVANCNFQGARFLGHADFHESIFDAGGNFIDAKFVELPNFNRATAKGEFPGLDPGLLP